MALGNETGITHVDNKLPWTWWCLSRHKKLAWLRSAQPRETSRAGFIRSPGVLLPESWGHILSHSKSALPPKERLHKVNTEGCLSKGREGGQAPTSGYLNPNCTPTRWNHCGVNESRNQTWISNSTPIPHVNRFNLHRKWLFMAEVNAELVLQEEKCEAPLLYVSASVTGRFFFI